MVAKNPAFTAIAVLAMGARMREQCDFQPSFNAFCCAPCPTKIRAVVMIGRTHRHLVFPKKKPNRRPRTSRTGVSKRPVLQGMAAVAEAQLQSPGTGRPGSDRTAARFGESPSTCGSAAVIGRTFVPAGRSARNEKSFAQRRPVETGVCAAIRRDRPGGHREQRSYTVVVVLPSSCACLSRQVARQVWCRSLFRRRKPLARPDHFLEVIAD